MRRRPRSVCLWEFFRFCARASVCCCISYRWRTTCAYCYDYYFISDVKGVKLSRSWIFFLLLHPTCPPGRSLLYSGSLHLFSFHSESWTLTALISPFPLGASRFKSDLFYLRKENKPVHIATGWRISFLIGLDPCTNNHQTIWLMKCSP